ncbi:hypothetical protein CLOP_g19924 [Closterium sp. NIES-67]|nr:hypothetical protein CLOP_g19924 [Closterium sp. NIES-67]
MTGFAPNVTAHAADLTTHSPDITAHATDVTTHSPDVTAHATDVTTHSPDVTAHTADLTTPSPDLTAHSADITTHSPDSHPTDPIDGHNSMVSSGSSMSIVSNISSINGCFMDPWPDTYTAAIGQHLEAPSAAGVCLDDLYLVPDDVTKVPGGIGNMRECQVIIGFGDSDLMHLFAAHGCDDMDLVLFDCSC